MDLRDEHLSSRKERGAYVNYKCCSFAQVAEYCTVGSPA
jgi:hypothetical protein